MGLKSKESPKILIDFLNYLIAIKGYSFNTVKNYYIDLMIYFKFLKEYLEIKINIKDFNVFILANIKEHVIIAFLVYLNFHRDNTAQTRQRRLSSVRTFYKWLLNNYPPFSTQENPTAHIANIEPVIRLPKYLNLDQARKIQTIFTKENSKFPERNNMIITLFLHTGLRLSELVNLDIKDIDFNRNIIRIIGKGNKERTVYIDKVLRKKLKEYLNIRNKNQKVVCINDALFISYQRKRLGIDGVADVCEKAYKLMGLEDYGYTTHTLRHTSATLIYKKTKDLLILKEFLGHNSLSATEIYLHTANDKIKDAVDKNPLNELVFKNKKVA